MKKEKMQSIANILDKCLKIFYVVNLIAGGFALLGGLIIIWADAWGVNKTINAVTDYMLGDVRITFAENVLFFREDIRIEITLILIGLVIITSIFFGVRICRKILVPMKDGRPFNEKSAENMKKLAMVVLIYNVLMEILINLFKYLKFQSYDLAPLISTNKIISITYEPDFDLKFLFIVGILYLLAYVFKYGEVLQQESDETL